MVAFLVRSEQTFVDVNFHFLSSKYVTLHVEINCLFFCWKNLIKIIVRRKKKEHAGKLGIFLRTTNNIK
jgi:hypothetical protein